jgi:hypothetical protein
MAGQTLHDYDLRLCDYVVNNIGEHWHKRGFVARVKKQLGSGPLWRYVEAYADPGREQARLLLNDSDLTQLRDAFEDGPFLQWEPYENYHGWYVDTMKEVRAKLGKLAADRWAAACNEFAKHLAHQRPYLAEGIGVVREWVVHLRGLLRAMGATALLPCPEGQSPTPTCETPASPSGPALLDDQLARDMETMREAIAEHERNNARVPASRRGRNAPPAALIEIAHIRPQRARQALRALEGLGEYSGFARPRSRRYLEGRPNER